VHSIGGWTALVAVLVIGPRLGRFGRDAVRIHGHDLPVVTVGVFILWVGWFGFNGGSLLGLTDGVPQVIVNTVVSGAVGGIAALALTWWRDSHPDIGTMMNGALAGLVGITASANITTTTDAVVIGAIAGGVMFGVTAVLERWAVDDAVGAIPVHLGAGVWGTLAVALFGDAGAFPAGTGRVEQFGIQALGVAVAFAWTAGIATIALRMFNRLYPLRVDPDGERLGLNVAEHNASTEILDLLDEMDEQRRTGDYSKPLTVEPNTEIGQIATQYNEVLAAINLQTERREAAVEALEAQTASLALLQSIASAANEAETLTEAMSAALQRVCKFTGWPAGHLYRVDQ
jgi:Amt family ammonium transporter